MNLKEQVTVLGPQIVGMRDILTTDALRFIAQLARRFRDDVAILHKERIERQAAWDAGENPRFSAASRAVREASWRLAAIPPDLATRQVEIVTPPTRQALIEALNSGADSCVVDCEDAFSPTWDNVIRAQINLRDAVDQSISSTEDSIQPSLVDDPASLIFRPRAWHQIEKHILVDRVPVPAPLVDAGLFLLHNADRLAAKGRGPYFCLSRLESGREARLWRDVMQFCEDEGKVDRELIRVNVRIDSLSAAFETSEILYELREYAFGLSCSHQSYLFSFIKAFNRRPDCVLPNWTDISRRSHCFNAYEKHVVGIALRRGAQAMGTRFSRHTIEDNPLASDATADALYRASERERQIGFSGSCVVDPPLVAAVRRVFDQALPAPGPRDDDYFVTAADLLQVVKGKITQRGLRANLRHSLAGIATWLAGKGHLLLDGDMQDAASTELSRAQIWQWVHHETGILDEGRNVTYAYFKALLREEMGRLKNELGDAEFDAGRFRPAAQLLDQLTGDSDFAAFFTTQAYAELEPTPNSRA